MANELSSRTEQRVWVRNNPIHAKRRLEWATHAFVVDKEGIVVMRPGAYSFATDGDDPNTSPVGAGI
jgi:hypothetical protein